MQSVDAERGGDGVRAAKVGGVGSVVATVASAFALRPEQIRGLRRGSSRAAFARQVAIYLLHTRLGLSYSASGALFGRDRTTAAYACRVVEEKREDARIDGIVDCLERAIDNLPGTCRGVAA